jgi:hypothetical protein
MRAVRLTHARWVNERVHGDAGAVLFLDDAEAAEVVASEAAVYDSRYDAQPSWSAGAAQETPAVKDEDTLRFTGEAERAAADQLIRESEDLGLYDPVAAIEEDLADMPLPEPESPTAPAIAELKPAWVKWAISQGCEPKLAAVLTKVQLVSRYGERL